MVANINTVASVQFPYLGGHGSELLLVARPKNTFNAFIDAVYVYILFLWFAVDQMWMKISLAWCGFKWLVCLHGSPRLIGL